MNIHKGLAIAICVITGVGFISLIVGLSTPSWTRYNVFHQGPESFIYVYQEGLWGYCAHKDCRPLSTQNKPAFLGSVRVFSLISLACYLWLIGSLVWWMLQLYRKAALWLVRCAAIMTSLISIITVSIYGGYYSDYLHYSFGLFTVGGILPAIVCFLTVYYKRPHKVRLPPSEWSAQRDALNNHHESAEDVKPPIDDSQEVPMAYSITRSSETPLNGAVPLNHMTNPNLSMQALSTHRLYEDSNRTMDTTLNASLSRSINLSVGDQPVRTSSRGNVQAPEEQYILGRAPRSIASSVNSSMDFAPPGSDGRANRSLNTSTSTDLGPMTVNRSIASEDSSIRDLTESPSFGRRRQPRPEPTRPNQAQNKQLPPNERLPPLHPNHNVPVYQSPPISPSSVNPQFQQPPSQPIHDQNDYQRAGPESPRSMPDMQQEPTRRHASRSSTDGAGPQPRRRSPGRKLPPSTQGQPGFVPQLQQEPGRVTSPTSRAPPVVQGQPGFVPQLQQEPRRVTSPTTRAPPVVQGQPGFVPQLQQEPRRVTSPTTRAPPVVHGQPGFVPQLQQEPRLLTSPTSSAPPVQSHPGAAPGQRWGASAARGENVPKSPDGSSNNPAVFAMPPWMMKKQPPTSPTQTAAPPAASSSQRNDDSPSESESDESVSETETDETEQ